MGIEGYDAQSYLNLGEWLNNSCQILFQQSIIQGIKMKLQ